MSDTFPGVGHRYAVDFGAWKTELEFHSTTSLTYTGVRPDGSHDDPQPVTIAIEPLRDRMFLVTWQECDKTTVVHLEDYRDNRITTHITGPDGRFDIYRGTMIQIG